MTVVFALTIICAIASTLAAATDILERWWDQKLRQNSSVPVLDIQPDQEPVLRRNDMADDWLQLIHKTTSRRTGVTNDRKHSRNTRRR